MDAGYCLPELRSQEDETSPTVRWLEALPDAEKERLLVEGKKYLAEVLDFAVDDTPHTFSIEFGQWGTDWPVFFDDDPDTFARMVWDIRGDFTQDGAFEILWKESEDGPSLALATVVGGKEKDLISVYQGEGFSIAKVQAGKVETSTEAASLSGLSWLRQGFLHVIPMGLDHILFILTLFFLCSKWQSLLFQSLLFTVAHSVTLALTVLGIAPVKPEVIEPLIALSIAYCALENLFVRELKPQRIALTVVFGLLHGLGFGSAMSELPVDRSQLLFPILFFNIGIEVAQVLILVACWLLTAFWREKGPFFGKIRVVSCLVMAVVALFWTVERIWF